MRFTFALSSVSFVGRFIIAFIILAYLYSQNREDAELKKGFRTLCILGAVFFALCCIGIFIGLFTFGLAGISHIAGHHYYF